MRGRTLLLVVSAVGLSGLAGGVALSAPRAAAARAARAAAAGFRRLDDAKSKASLPFAVTGGGTGPVPGIPDVIGASFDPSTVDELAIAGDGRAVAWTTVHSEAGVPGATRDVVIFREGRSKRDRASDAAGDNDQPSLDPDRFGLRATFRGSAGARGTTPGNVYLRSTTIRAGTPGADGSTPPPTEEVTTVRITDLVATATDARFGTAWDPTLAARIRVRDAGSGVKVRERDARVAFASTGDLQRGRNAAHRPQLFLWREIEEDFVQLTAIAADGFAVNRPSISAGGDRIAFESNADLTPDAADPRDPSRVGNPSRVRQVYLWELGRGVRQLTWSDRDCLAPRIARDGRTIVFCSRGDLIAGGNPEGNFEIFGWADVRDPARRVRQLTRTAQGDSVLPRPAASRSQFTFWSTAAPAAGSSAFGDSPKQAGPLAYAARGARVRRVGGLTDAENLARIAQSPDPTSAESPVVTGPPCAGRALTKVHFVSNDPRLNVPGADDDLDGDDGKDGKPDDRRVDVSLIFLHVARVTPAGR